MIFRRKQIEQPRIELTSLVDVVFLLLIFFMISTTFIESPGLDIVLPEAGSQRQHTDSQEFRVEVTKAGDIFVAQQPISLSELKEQLRQILVDQPESQFVLLADQQTNHGRVVQLMDLARQTGFRSLAISTRAATPPVDEGTQ